VVIVGAPERMSVGKKGDDMGEPAEDADLQAYIEECWAKLEQLESQRKQLERALEASTDPDIRARRWKSLARLEQEIEEIDARLSKIQNW
jgi:septal ring factor EnvC (AmiA/AmiB activator)